MATGTASRTSWDRAREQRIASVGITRSYSLAPDGKRIAALMPVDVPEAQKAQNHIIFLENFFDEVRRRVGSTGK